MSGADWPSSLHLVGSKALGGAERWVQRFAAALAECGASAAVGVRRGSAVAELHMGGLPVHPLPFWSVWDPISRQAITRLVRAMRPDLVQTYMGRATRLTRLSGARRPLHIARLGGYYKLAPYRHADAWIGNTRGLCDWMIGQGLPAAQVHHIYNFVDRAEAYPAGDIEVLRQRLHLREDTWVMLTLGRLIAVKGHGCLLDALARLPAHIGGRPWCLVLVGEGPLRAALEHQAMALGIAERLVWVGWQPEPGPYLQLADLVVFPSRDAETLGNVILEAWAWRRALLTTRFRGAREIARHGEDAWCVVCDDASALAEGMQQLLRDDGLRAELVRQGTRRVEAEFSKEVILAHYLDCYRSVLRS